MKTAKVRPVRGPSPWLDRKTESDSEIPNNCEVECEKCKHFREEADTYMKQCEYYFMECRFEPKDS